MQWDKRLKNPVFWVQILLSIMVPILTYFGLQATDITTWSILFGTLKDAIGNPYIIALVIVSVWNACNNPTTKGLSDIVTIPTEKK